MGRARENTWFQLENHHLRYPLGARDTVESLSVGIASSQEQRKRKEEAEEGRKAAEEAEQAVPAAQGLSIPAAPFQGLSIAVAAVQGLSIAAAAMVMMMRCLFFSYCACHASPAHSFSHLSGAPLALPARVHLRKETREAFARMHR